MNKHISVRIDNHYSQIPHWVTESIISDGALRLYLVLSKYANNTTKEAYPSRSTLARDLRKTDRSVDTYIKELKAIGALKVVKRKRRGTDEFYSNLYTVITANPNAAAELDAAVNNQDWEEVQEVAKMPSPPSETNFALTKPKQLHPTNTSSTPSEQVPQVQKDSSTPETSSSRSFTPETSSGPPNPGNLSHAQRKKLRAALQSVGKALTSGRKFYDEPTQELWETFIDLVEETFGDDFEIYGFSDLLVNMKWKLTAKVADPYEAGTELNTLIWTALKH